MLDYFTADGEELVMRMLQISRGELKAQETRWTAEGEPITCEVGPSIKEMESATRWLSERKWGKATETLKVEASRAEEGSVDLTLMDAGRVSALFTAARALGDTQIVDGEVVDDVKSTLDEGK